MRYTIKWGIYMIVTSANSPHNLALHDLLVLSINQSQKQTEQKSIVLSINKFSRSVVATLQLTLTMIQSTCSVSCQHTTPYVSVGYE